MSYEYVTSRQAQSNPELAQKSRVLLLVRCIDSLRKISPRLTTDTKRSQKNINLQTRIGISSSLARLS
jgi:hypothetical protein